MAVQRVLALPSLRACARAHACVCVSVSVCLPGSASVYVSVPVFDGDISNPVCALMF
jgi:hypothetical protein